MLCYVVLCVMVWCVVWKQAIKHHQSWSLVGHLPLTRRRKQVTDYELLMYCTNITPTKLWYRNV